MHGAGPSALRPRRRPRSRRGSPRGPGGAAPVAHPATFRRRPVGTRGAGWWSRSWAQHFPRPSLLLTEPCSRGPPRAPLSLVCMCLTHVTPFSLAPHPARCLGTRGLQVPVVTPPEVRRHETLSRPTPSVGTLCSDPACGWRPRCPAPCHIINQVLWTRALHTLMPGRHQDLQSA